MDEQKYAELAAEQRNMKVLAVIDAIIMSDMTDWSKLEAIREFSGNIHGSLLAVNELDKQINEWHGRYVKEENLYNPYIQTR